MIYNNTPISNPAEQDPYARRRLGEVGQYRAFNLSRAWTNSRHSVGVVNALVEAIAPSQATEVTRLTTEIQPVSQTTTPPATGEGLATVTPIEGFDRAKAVSETEELVSAAYSTEPVEPVEPIIRKAAA